MGKVELEEGGGIIKAEAYTPPRSGKDREIKDNTGMDSGSVVILGTTGLIIFRRADCRPSVP